MDIKIWISNRLMINWSSWTGAATSYFRLESFGGKVTWLTVTVCLICCLACSSQLENFPSCKKQSMVRRSQGEKLKGEHFKIFKIFFYLGNYILQVVRFSNGFKSRRFDWKTNSFYTYHWNFSHFAMRFVMRSTEWRRETPFWLKSLDLG